MFWSKESTFEKFYHKGINAEDPHFQLSILKSFEERSSEQWLLFSSLMRRQNSIRSNRDLMKQNLELPGGVKRPVGNSDFMNKIKANHLILPPSTPNLIIPFFRQSILPWWTKRKASRTFIYLCKISVNVISNYNNNNNNNNSNNNNKNNNNNLHDFLNFTCILFSLFLLIARIYGKWVVLPLSLPFQTWTYKSL